MTIARLLLAATLLGAALPARAGPIPVTLLILMPGEKAHEDEFLGRLQRVPFFTNAKNEHATNVLLVVSVAQVPTMGGSAATATTGLLAATTLGLLPTVENKDVSVHYELRVNQMTVASFDYNRNFTSVSSIYGGMGKLPEDARQWVLQTVEEFSKATQASPALAALQAEYESYFRK